jgi:formate dehydrogenase subunit gamma
MTAYVPWNAESARALIGRLSTLEGATLPILHALQEEFGFVHPDTVPLIADALNLSRAEVHGAISFYHDFRSSLPAKRVIKLCRAEACQALGSEALAHHAARRHGLSCDGHGEERGDVAIETVYCLGNCALGPAALVEGGLIAHMTDDKLSALINGASPEDVQSLAEDMA